VNWQPGFPASDVGSGRNIEEIVWPYFSFTKYIYNSYSETFLKGSVCLPCTKPWFQFSALKKKSHTKLSQ
jgi:hypothetical protein